MTFPPLLPKPPLPRNEFSQCAAPERWWCARRSVFLGQEATQEMADVEQGIHSAAHSFPAARY
ncbi:hypothetical protein E2C01_001404 [Portunus trituberculatus]|uniref:Uncharacterized protein n=1 Tax=Portunus trituberculatus TaxID=210409 RepID=A0A5B7CJ72_PORTR|nr:hypothetical protein [Portunus trituberculatus]